MLAIKCWGNLRIFQFVSTMCQQKNCQRLRRSHCMSCRQWLHHTSAFCQELWFGFLLVGNTYSTNIILFTYNTLKLEKRQYFSQWSPCFCFSGCSCYNRRTYNPTVENPGAQNITACESQSMLTQTEWSLKIKKKVFKKNNRG